MLKAINLKAVIPALTALFFTSLLTPLIPAAHAVGLPSIRITSPAYTSANSNDYSSDITSHFTAGSKSFTTYLKLGTTETVTYHVTTNGTTAAAAHQRVAIEANAAFSNSKATWVVSGSGTSMTGVVASSNVVVAAQVGDTASATVTGYTDANGDVTFTYRNTDAATTENTPTAINQARSSIVGARQYGQFKPLLVSDTGSVTAANAVDVDFITFDIYSGTISVNNPTPTPNANTLTTARLISGTTGVEGVVTHDEDASSWSQYYNTGLHYKDAYVRAGSTFNFKWQVTDAAGTPIANQAVTLIVNKGYSGSTATWRLNGNSATVNPVVPNTAPDGGSITGTTDANGFVTFSITDISTSAEPSTTATTAKDPNTIKVFGQFALQVGSLSLGRVASGGQSVDIVDVHVLAALGSQPANPNPTPTPASLPVARLIFAQSTGLLGSFDATSAASDWAHYYGAGLKYWNAFMTVGTSAILKWRVTDASDNAKANLPVKLIVNKGYSGSTATWSVQSKTAAGVGSFTPTNGANINGVTDANGYVSWLVTNTNSSGEPADTPINKQDTQTSFGQFTLNVNDIDQGLTTLDIVDIHLLNQPTAIQPIAVSTLPNAGSAIVSIAGSASTVTTTASNNAVSITNSGATFTAKTLNTLGADNSLSTSNILSSGLDGAINLNLTGLAANSTVSVYLRSDPVLLGSFTTNASGALNVNIPLLSVDGLGSHTLQVIGSTASNSAISVAVPIEIAAPTIAIRSQSNPIAGITYKVFVPPAKKFPEITFKNNAKPSLVYNSKLGTASCFTPVTNTAPTNSAFYFKVNGKLVAVNSTSALNNADLHGFEGKVGRANIFQSNLKVEKSWSDAQTAKITCELATSNSTGIAIGTSNILVILPNGKLPPKHK